MKYLLTFRKEFRAIQGLKSPLRDASQLPSLQPKDGYTLQLIVGIEFDERQLNDQGWFIDADSLDSVLDELCGYLGSKKWTE